MSIQYLNSKTRQMLKSRQVRCVPNNKNRIEINISIHVP